MSAKKITIRTLIFIIIVVFAQQLFISCTPSPKEKYIGLQLWSVRQDMGKEAAATLASVGEMGYKFVETASYADGKIYDLEPLAFKSLCEQNGLDFLGAHTGQDVPDSANWDETMEWWDACIATHKSAGIKWIVQPWMGESGYTSLEGLKKYCEYFNAVGEKCNAAGIRFGYHNHDKEFTTVHNGKPVYDWMLEFTNPEKVMFQMDLYWITVGGKKATDYFEKYPGRFELWHIKDKAELGGEGKIMDFAPIFAEKEKAGVKYGIVEVEEYNFEPLESCKKSIEFLNNADYVRF